MKKTTLSWLLMLGFVAAASAQPKPAPAAEPKPAPKIDFASTVFNFGRVKSGDTVKHDFVFTNSGNATLEITGVKPGCGCTTAGVWDKTVEPGKTGVIPLQFRSAGFGGRVGKSTFVTCNVPGHSNVILQITGTVWKPIDVTPAMAMFTLSSEALTNASKVLHIVNNLEEPITFSDVKCNNSSFRAEVKALKPGKEFELVVTAVPPFSSPTTFSTITLKTSSTNVPLLSVSAYATVQQAVMVTPHQVMLPTGPLNQAVTSTVLVRNNSTNVLAISDVHLDLPGVEVKLNEPQNGRLYTITMHFPAGFEIPAGQRPELTFKTTHPHYPLLKVPVLQRRPLAVVPARPSVAPPQLKTASPLRPASPLRLLKPPVSAAPAAAPAGR